MEGAKRCDGPSKHKLQNLKKKYCWIVCRKLPDCGKHACILLCYANLFHNSDIMCRSLLCSFVNAIYEEKTKRVNFQGNPLYRAVILVSDLC